MISGHQTGGLWKHEADSFKSAVETFVAPVTLTAVNTEASFSTILNFMRPHLQF